MLEFFIVRESDKRQLYDALAEQELPYKVKISKGSRRTLEQNAYYWGVVVETLLSVGGLRELGWDKDDVHKYFLGEYHGWKVLKGLGKTRMKPLDGSSNKSISEMMDYIDFVIRKAAEIGIVIPDAES